MKRMNKAFTLIELLFVIVILGIVAGLALEAIRQYYNGIYRTNEYAKRVAQADQVLEQISKYFENAVSASMIRLDQDNALLGSTCVGILTTGDDAHDYTIAFVGVDNDGIRGFWDGTRWRPGWSSHVISSGALISSPESNYTALNNISALNTAAIFRNEGLGEGSDECHRFGWDLTGAATEENHVYRAINSVDSDTNLTLNAVLSVSGESDRAYLLRSAYAFRAKDGNFSMYSDFQPWSGEQYTAATAHLLADKVSHFTVLYDISNTSVNSAIGNVFTLKICMKGLDENLSDTDDRAHQICRERMVHVRY